MSDYYLTRNAPLWPRGQWLSVTMVVPSLASAFRNRIAASRMNGDTILPRLRCAAF